MRPNISRALTTRRLLFSVAAAWATLLANEPGVAQPLPDPDWPCVQALVPEISPAVIWPGPPLGDIERRWQDSADTAALAAALTDRRIDDDTRQQKVREYSSRLNSTDVHDELSLLFVAVLEILNRRRDEYIRGIKRFTRQQQDLAEKTEAYLNELVELETETAPEAAARRAEIHETVQWMRRMFDNREQSIHLLCEQPVRVEQRAGMLARAIADAMDQN